jgi:hypothetical protein
MQKIQLSIIAGRSHVLVSLTAIHLFHERNYHRIGQTTAVRLRITGPSHSAFLPLGVFGVGAETSPHHQGGLRRQLV